MRRLLLPLLFVVVIGFDLSALATSDPRERDASGAYTDTEVYRLTNRVRAEAGLEELRWSDKLARAAKLKARDLFERQYFDHHLKGEDIWQFTEKVGYRYRILGENLAIYYDTPEAVVKAWMASPGHRENILRAGFTEIGIAVVSGSMKGKPGTIVVQEFGTPKKR